MRVEEEYKKTGYFWLPDKVENKIPGILSIDDGGKIELEIVGHFDEDMKPLRGDYNLNRIIGHIEKDGLVTIDDCFYTKKNFSFGGISKSKIRASTVLSGAAWDKNEKIAFDTFSFSVDCLDEWLGISGIDVDYDWYKKTATISYKPPKKTTIKINNGMSLEICFAYTLPRLPYLTEAKITQRAYFRLYSEYQRSLSDFISIAFKITNLMCFAMDEIVSLKNISATSFEIQRDGGDDKKQPAPILIYYQSKPFSENIPKKTGAKCFSILARLKPMLSMYLITG